MYLISQIYKPGRTGWRYLCNIFLATDSQVRNVTDSMSARLWLIYKWWNIVISHWSGTGVMIITNLLEKYTWSIYNRDIFNVSVFR